MLQGLKYEIHIIAYGANISQQIQSAMNRNFRNQYPETAATQQ
jgi:hypothetical protein